MEKLEKLALYISNMFLSMTTEQLEASRERRDISESEKLECRILESLDLKYIQKDTIQMLLYGLH